MTFGGTALPAVAKTYEALPFAVVDGTTRVEVAYDWTELLPPAGAAPASSVDRSTFDLGLWDQRGIGQAEAFRGWSGSRGGRVSSGQEPVFVQQDEAARGYVPAPIEAGTWTVDLGIAALSPGGADWVVTVTCSAPAVGDPFVPRPVDPDLVLSTEPGWYHADFHVHAFHSNPEAPTWDDAVTAAAARGIDVVFATEYVTGQHWAELGPVQDAHPDVLVVPGREIITYFGHANALGPTPSALDHRHGAPGVSLADIQVATVADGALFQVNHPTIFPEAEFGSLCRGCDFTLDDVIDWDLVTTYEVLNGPVDSGGDAPTESPFVQTSLDEWQSLLLDGHRLTAVSGSDSKGVEPNDAERQRAGYGSSATAIRAESLSRRGIEEALVAGRAYIRTRGVDRSPEVDVALAAAGGLTGTLGDSVPTDAATLTVIVVGGTGQQVVVTADGEPVGAPLTVDADPFTARVDITRSAASGPLGTFVRVDTIDRGVHTTIGNPVYLVAPGTGATTTITTAPPATSTTTEVAAPGGDGDDDGGDGVPAAVLATVVLGVLVAAGVLVSRTRAAGPGR